MWCYTHIIEKLVEHNMAKGWKLKPKGVKSFALDVNSKKRKTKTKRSFALDLTTKEVKKKKKNKRANLSL